MVDNGLPVETINSLEEPGVEKALCGLDVVSTPSDASKSMPTQAPKFVKLDCMCAFTTVDRGLKRKPLSRDFQGKYDFVNT